MRKKQWVALFIVIIIITVPSHLLMNKFVYHYDLNTLIGLIIKRLIIGTLTIIGTFKLFKMNDKK